MMSCRAAGSIRCFETKSGEMQGDEEENVVRGDTGRKEKLILSTG